MRFPLHITTDQVGYQIRKAVAGQTRYPLVLMLEPLYTCNLACVGCSTERHTGKLADRLPLETCLRAVAECGAPTVSLCGGEPTLYPELPELVAGIIGRKRLTINVHLDGMRETHDKVCAREGVFDKAIEMIRQAKARGYHVTTNTTVFKETSLEEIEELCKLVKSLGVDGLLVSPGYHYESVKADIFLTKQEIQRKFKRVLELSKDYPLQSTPMYLEFAAGMREYDCSPWSTVTFTPKGWKKPCYLIGEEYVPDWNEFWTKTDWAYWESRQDDKCQNCAMHSGFEASAVRGLRNSPKDLLRMAAWNFLG